MFDHERARELALTPAVDLDPAERDWLADHLDACEPCRAFVSDAAAAAATSADATAEGRPLDDEVPTPGSDVAVPPRAPQGPIARRLALSEALSRRGVVITVVAVAVTLVAGGLFWNSAPRLDGRTADASLPAGTASPESSDAADPWASLEPSSSFEPMAGENRTPSALLTARGADGVVVALDAEFRLASIDATPASRLAARLTVEPAFAFSIKPDANDRAALLTPKKPLLPGIVYRFALSGPAGELLDTWAFQARQPLRIVGTLPDNQANDVPLDTGIEITFDQDGVADAASHMTVTPATPGRFEQHGRTLAFIPNRPLAPGTIYRVVVTRGVKVTSTGEATATDTRFQFETATTKDTTGIATFEFQDQVVESATTERPTIGLWGQTFDQENPAPKTTPIQVYRLANLDAAITAFRGLRARPDWSRWSTDGLVDTSTLTRVVAMDSPLNKYNDSFFIRLPNRLPVGWYVVQDTAGVRPVQVILQVTDVAGYLAVSDTRTLVWANDLKTGRPIVGAAATSDGVAIGTTDVHGLAIGSTPRSLRPKPLDECDHPCDPVVTVRAADGRSIFLPAATPQDKSEGFGDTYYWYAADSSYWSLLHTDRNRYRQTDTVNLWGVVRDRDTGKIPAAVTVRLTLQSNGGGPDRPAIANLSLKPGSTGAFHASIPLTAQPEGYYTLAVLQGDTIVRTSDIVVGPIAKPAYRLEITTGRRVYIAGDRIKITANAAFFEGTPVPGVPLRIDGFLERSVTTDATGTATYLTTAKAEPDQEGPNSTSVGASPATAEEGEIAAVSRGFVIFPSTRTIDATASIAGGKVRVSGSVHVVAVDRLEKGIAGGLSPWELDPRAEAVAGARVTARFVELVPHRRQVGTQYDFIEKKVVPTYDDTIIERSAGTVQVKTARNGTYTLSIPASVADHDYRITLSVADAAGLVARITTYGNRHPWNSYEGQSASLHLTTVRPNADESFSIGDRVDVTMTDPATKQAGGDGTRYLFFVAQRGIHTATVQTSPRFSTTFQRWAAPNIDIGGVRFTGRGYVGTVMFVAQFRAADRRLQIDLSTTAARYRPGETATVRVRTRTASGAPVAATVTLRAVDEKLFSMGFAEADDPLRELYSLIGSGVLGTYQSHRTPRIDSGGGGDTGGGGDDRDEFRDSLLFQTITTGSDGRGTVSFKISDDLTSWRVTASGITSRLEVGSGSVLVPVGLPFFVDASIAPEYLVADRPTIAVRTFGSLLKTGDPVAVQVTSASLGFDSGPIRSTAFATIGVPLPSLSEGLETLTISATTGSGATARTDRLTRSFAVVTTRLLRTRTSYVELPSSAAFAGGDGLTRVVVSDASAGRYLSLLNQLESSSSARLDARLAAEVARALLVSRYGSAASSFDPISFDSHRYQGSDDGMSLLPYSSSDLELSALVAIVAPDRVERTRLGAYLRAVLADRGETRERQMFALAGLAGLGDPVLAAIRTAAADPSLTIREQLMIGLGAAALGDAATARSISAALISQHGERLGGEARLRVGTSAADITSATALMAVLGAALGDPRAAQFWAYVEANPSTDRLEALTAVAHVTYTLDHLPVQPATFAYTVDGTRRVVDLEPGETFEVGLTSAQLASLKVDRLAGAVGVATTWREPVRPAALVADPDMTLSRSVSPSSVGSADLVRVELTIKFGPQTAAGCHQVTELVPSGLAPVGSLAGWVDPDSEEPPDPGVVMPYDQSGSRVFFCAEPTTSQRNLVLRYYARVITPGTYAWEPAIAESTSQDGHAALTPATTITVR